MPTITEQSVEAYAFCPNARCDGHKQQVVKAIRTEEGYTYAELGGDLPGIEKSMIRLKFPVVKGKQPDLACPTCGRNRELSETRRRRYSPQMFVDGQPLDQEAILELRPDAFDKNYDPEYEVVGE